MVSLLGQCESEIRPGGRTDRASRPAQGGAAEGFAGNGRAAPRAAVSVLRARGYVNRMSDDERTEAENPAEPDDDARSKAQAEEQEVEEAKKTMQELEEGDP